MKSRIAVISDIHGNADSLKKVLGELKNQNVTKTVVLGDLLTYGCQPQEVLDMLIQYNHKNPSIFIQGNHDQFYFDLQSGKKQSSYRLPKFIDESVKWTLEKISSVSLKDSFIWHKNISIGNVHFSHSNSLPYGNWSYIEKPEVLEESFNILLANKFFAGVYGHSHRHSFIGKKNETLQKIDKYSFTSNKLDQLIINAGSIGQPRGEGIGYLILDMFGDNLEKASFKKIHIDFDNSIRLINQANLSEETKFKIISYLEN